MQQKSELTIPEQFQVMDEQLTNAKFSFAMYRLIALDTSKLSKTEHNKLALNYYNLVQAQKVVISQTLMIQLHKFFDTNPKSIQMSKIIGQCGSTSRQISQKFAALQSDHVATIQKLRNRVYAHTDIYEKPSDIFDDKTTYTDLKNIIEELEIIMQDISMELSISRKPGVESCEVENEFESLLKKGMA